MRRHYESLQDAQRPTPLDSVHASCARLSAQLARERRGACRTLEELAHDACCAVAAARTIRHELEHGRQPPASELILLAGIALAYGAEYVDRRDLAGLVAGFRFRSGSYTAGFHNIYMLS